MGIAPKYYEKVLGKKLLKKVTRGQPISFQDFE
jgi:sialic acid synthase SpsE